MPNCARCPYSFQEHEIKEVCDGCMKDYRRRKEVSSVDTFSNCPFRDDRACKAAPYYGTAECEWAVDREECPEPGTAIASLEDDEEIADEYEHQLREEVADDAHRIPSHGKEW